MQCSIGVNGVPAHKRTTVSRQDQMLNDYHWKELKKKSVLSKFPPVLWVVISCSAGHLSTHCIYSKAQCHTPLWKRAQGASNCQQKKHPKKPPTFYHQRPYSCTLYPASVLHIGPPVLGLWAPPSLGDLARSGTRRMLSVNLIQNKWKESKHGAVAFVRLNAVTVLVKKKKKKRSIIIAKKPSEFILFMSRCPHQAKLMH